MSTFHSLESRRQSAATRHRIAVQRAAGFRSRKNRLETQRAFIFRLDVLWIATATACGFKATRAALWLAYRAGTRRRKHPDTWLLEIPCSTRPPAFLAGSARSFRDGLRQLVAAGLLRKRPRNGQHMSCYDILLPPASALAGTGLDEVEN
jgi:hypothetical protein